jgi:hypothetical protein
MNDVNDAINYLDLQVDNSEIIEPIESKSLNINNSILSIMSDYYGFLAVAKESQYGVANPAAKKRFIAISDESINNDLNIDYVETIASRERKGFFSGGLTVGGDFSFLAEPENVGEILQYAFGNMTVTPEMTTGETPTPTGYYIREYTPSEKVLPSFTIYLNRSRLLDTVILGAKVGTLEFTFDTGSAVNASVTIAAQNQDEASKLGISMPTDVVFSDLMPFPYHEVKVYDVIDGTKTYMGIVTSLTLTLENNLVSDTFVLGSKNIAPISEGALAVSGSMDIVFKDSTYFRRFMDNTTFGLEVTCSYPGDSNMIMSFDLPKVIAETADVNMGGIEQLTQTVDFTALKDLGGKDYSIKATLKNKSAEPSE